MVVPNTLSRKAITKLLCQRCLNPLDGSKNDGDKGETIQALLETNTVRNEPSADDVRAEQQKVL